MSKDKTVLAGCREMTNAEIVALVDLHDEDVAKAIEDALKIVRVTEARGKHYAVMQNRRYIKQIRAFQQLLESGTMGALGSVHADFFLGSHFGGFRELMIDMAIHTFDQARLKQNQNSGSTGQLEWTGRSLGLFR